MIVDLCRKFDVAKVTFDRWQSIEMIQSLRAQGIASDFHSVKKSDYDTLMTSIYDTRLRGYWNEILVNEELLKLRLFSNNKIDHPSGGSKDMADSLAGSVFNCVENIAVEQEVEIEVLDFSIQSEIDEDLEDFGAVSLYNDNLRQFTPVDKKINIPGQEVGKWIESI
jgi:hypothetical protein